MADQKTTALTALTVFSGDELFYVVEDDDGTPVSRKVTVEDLATGLGLFMPAKVCKVTRSAALTLTNNSATAIPWDAEETDTYGWHESVTNPSRITPTVAGKFRVGAVWRSTDAFADQKQMVIALRKNGTDIVGGTDDRWSSGATGRGGARAETVVELNGTTDYVQAVYFHLHGADRSFDTTVSAMWCSYIGS